MWKVKHCIGCLNSFQEWNPWVQICRDCFGKLTPGERASLTAAMWQYKAVCDLEKTLSQTRVEINLFRVFLEEFVAECRSAVEEDRPFKWPPFEGRN